MLFSVLTLVLRCCDAAAVMVVGSRLSLHLSLGRGVFVVSVSSYSGPGAVHRPEMRLRRYVDM